MAGKTWEVIYSLLLGSVIGTALALGGALAFHVWVSGYSGGMRDWLICMGFLGDTFDLLCARLMIAAGWAWLICFLIAVRCDQVQNR